MRRQENRGSKIRGEEFMDGKKELWNKTVAFHGHSCPGLMIGYRASLYAIELLGLTFSEDEGVVCICENDTCSVDALQVILGCSVGKGNLLFRMRGKQAFNVYNRKTGKSVRLVLKSPLKEMSREESLHYYQTCDAKEMFEVKTTSIEIPERARLFESYVCECCGEKTGANWIRLFDGKKLCLDCYKIYDRFNV